MTLKHGHLIICDTEKVISEEKLFPIGTNQIVVKVLLE